MNRNFVREDDRLVAYIKILTELVSFKTEAMVLEDVFNWALPLLHNPAVHNAVCSLITTICQPLMNRVLCARNIHLKWLLTTFLDCISSNQELCNLSNS
uniref:Uncharacterized protein n=1 Tax=Ditylenchus dipsaci TaxID=166011 RepID=A0A915E7V1_9BILA